jgi:hypothetical protein
MATYNEIADLLLNEDWGIFLQKVTVACAVKATEIINSTTPGATALEWAQSTIQAPKLAAKDLVFYVVASNKSATISQIVAATDTAVQTNVDTAVDALYGV